MIEKLKSLGDLKDLLFVKNIKINIKGGKIIKKDKNMVDDL